MTGGHTQAGPKDDRLPGGNRDAPAIGDDKPREDEPGYSKPPEDDNNEDEDNDGNVEAGGQYNASDNKGGERPQGDRWLIFAQDMESFCAGALQVMTLVHCDCHNCPDLSFARRDIVCHGQVT